MGRFAKSAAEAVLRVAAAASVVLAALWVLGYNGAGVVDSGLPGGAERVITSPELTSWGALPSTDVILRERGDVDELYDVTRRLGARDAGIDYDLFTLPWGAIAAGGALLAIAHVWRRGVTLEADVKGLV